MREWVLAYIHSHRTLTLYPGGAAFGWFGFGFGFGLYADCAASASFESEYQKKHYISTHAKNQINIMNITVRPRSYVNEMKQ